MNPSHVQCAIWITRNTYFNDRNRENSVFENFKITANGGNRFKLPELLFPERLVENIESEVCYSEYVINTKLIPYTPPIYTYGSIIPSTSAPLTPTTEINIKTKESALLVSALHFEQN